MTDRRRRAFVSSLLFLVTLGLAAPVVMAHDPLDRLEKGDFKGFLDDLLRTKEFVGVAGGAASAGAATGLSLLLAGGAGAGTRTGAGRSRGGGGTPTVGGAPPPPVETGTRIIDDPKEVRAWLLKNNYLDKNGKFTARFREWNKQYPHQRTGPLGAIAYDTDKGRMTNLVLVVDDGLPPPPPPDSPVTAPPPPVTVPPPPPTPTPPPVTRRPPPETTPPPPENPCKGLENRLVEVERVGQELVAQKNAVAREVNRLNRRFAAQRDNTLSSYGLDGVIAVAGLAGLVTFGPLGGIVFALFTAAVGEALKATIGKYVFDLDVDALSHSESGGRGALVDVFTQGFEESLKQKSLDRHIPRAAAESAAKATATRLGVVLSTANNTYDLYTGLEEANETKRQIQKLKQVLRRDLEPRVNAERRKRDILRNELDDCLRLNGRPPAR